MSLIIRAAQFATFAHTNQERKYTGRPYITHPARVAGMVSFIYPAVTEEMIAAAWLHDTIEDCKIAPSELRSLFGNEVTQLVVDLTNTSKLSHPDASRRERKKMDIDRVARIPIEAQVLKVLDRVDNLNEIPIDNEDAVDFMKGTYFGESHDLLQEALHDTDVKLWNILRRTLEEVHVKFFETL